MPVLFPIGRLDSCAPGRAFAPRRPTAPVSLGLGALCAAVFVVAQEGGQATDWAATYGLTPSTYVEAALPELVAAPVTSLFAHASWPHLLYNLAALWVFGGAVERHVGSARFGALFVGLGAAAMVAEALAHPTSTAPIVGASGAVAASAGAFAVAFPKARVVLATVFLTVPVRARSLLAVWLAVEVLAWADLMPATGVAHVGHLAGFALGALAMVRLSPRGPNGPRPNLMDF